MRGDFDYPKVYSRYSPQLSLGLFLSFATAGLAFLSGCATSAEPLAEDEYHPPATNASTATLKGSRLSESGLFGDDHTGFVLMVDLKSVRDAADWSEPVAITAGRHSVIGEYRYSNFLARADIPLQADAGTAYQLMIKNGHEPADGKPFCDFWIVNLATGKTVTLVYHAQATGGKKGTIFNVPY